MCEHWTHCCVLVWAKGSFYNWVEWNIRVLRGKDLLVVRARIISQRRELLFLLFCSETLAGRVPRGLSCHNKAESESEASSMIRDNAAQAQKHQKENKIYIRRRNGFSLCVAVVLISVNLSVQVCHWKHEEAFCGQLSPKFLSQPTVSFLPVLKSTPFCRLFSQGLSQRLWTLLFVKRKSMFYIMLILSQMEGVPAVKWSRLISAQHRANNSPSIMSFLSC